jgi:DNA invertase Pin-like site-specific DNA recombinase
MFAVGLVRVSTNEQSLGLAAQQEAVEAVCAREGLPLRSLIVEDGVSGMLALNDRSGLRKALSELAEGTGGCLVVAEGSRIARNPLTQLLVEARIAELGGRIISAKGEGYGSTSATEIFSSRVLMAQRELESNLTKERTVASLRALKNKKNGRYFAGRPRFGFRVVAGELVPHPVEWPELARWFDRREDGWKQREIAAESTRSRSFIAQAFRRYGSLAGLLAFTQKECPSAFTVQAS